MIPSNKSQQNFEFINSINPKSPTVCPSRAYYCRSEFSAPRETLSTTFTITLSASATSSLNSRGHADSEAEAKDAGRVNTLL